MLIIGWTPRRATPKEEPNDYAEAAMWALEAGAFTAVLTPI